MKRMKKMLALLLAVSMVASMVPITASATEVNGGENVALEPPAPDGTDILASGYCGEDVIWVLNAGGTLTIQGNGEMDSWQEQDAVPPWESYKDMIVQVVIEEGVTTVGHGAFEEYTNLLEVSLPNTMKELGVTAFNACTSLAQINIPEGLESFGQLSLANCSLLKNIKLPESTVGIGPHAFQGLDLGDVVIPAATNNLSALCFNDAKINSLTVDEENSSYYTDGKAIYTKDNKLHSYLDVGENPETSYEILDGTTSILMSSFNASDVIRHIVVPETVTDLEMLAFASASLETITFKGDAPVFANAAFRNCKSVVVYYPITNPTWTEDVLQQYEGTVEWIPYGVSDGGEFGEGFSWQLSADNTLTISGTGVIPTWENAEEIPWYQYILQIKKVVLEEGITGISKSLFENCENLLEISLPETLITIGDRAFYNTGVKEITIPAGISEISAESLITGNVLAEINVDEDNTSFKAIEGVLFSKDGTKLYAYPENKSGAVYEIPNNVTEIRSGAFAYNKNLKGIIFAENAPAFAEDCFSETTLVAFYPVDNATWTDEIKKSYGGYITWNVNDTSYTAFGTCGKNVTWLLKEDGTLIISGQGKLEITEEAWTSHSAEIAKVIVKEGITSIYPMSLGGAPNLTEVELPDSVEAIGMWAFESTAIKEIHIPAGVVYLDPMALLVRDSLEKITVDEANTAFKAIDGVLYSKDGKALHVYPVEKDDEVYQVPEEVDTVKAYSFMLLSEDDTNCLQFTGNAPTFEENCFMESTLTVKYPENDATWTEEIMQQYGGTITWEAYDPAVIDKGIVGKLSWVLGVDGTLTVSGEGSMVDNFGDEYVGGNTPWLSYAEQIKKVIVEKGITDVAPAAFAMMPNLASVELADSVTEIGIQAFWGDMNLTEAELPEGLEAIREYAFTATGLKSLHLPSTVVQLGKPAFSFSPIETITVAEGNKAFYAEEDALFTIDGKELLAYATGKNIKTYTIPEGVTTINDGVFINSVYLEEIVIPSTITDLKAELFSESSNLKAVKFVGNAPVFNANTFSGAKLTVYYPEGNATWTNEVMQQYGGTITWEAYEVIDPATVINNLSVFEKPEKTVYIESIDQPETEKLHEGMTLAVVYNDGHYEKVEYSVSTDSDYAQLGIVSKVLDKDGNEVDTYQVGETYSVQLTQEEYDFNETFTFEYISLDTAEDRGLIEIVKLSKTKNVYIAGKNDKAVYTLDINKDAHYLVEMEAEYPTETGSYSVDIYPAGNPNSEENRIQSEALSFAKKNELTGDLATGKYFVVISNNGGDLSSHPLMLTIKNMTPEKVEVVSLPKQTVLYPSDEAKMDGLKVEVTYEDASKETITYGTQRWEKAEIELNVAEENDNQVIYGGTYRTDTEVLFNVEFEKRGYESHVSTKTIEVNTGKTFSYKNAPYVQVFEFTPEEDGEYRFYAVTGSVAEEISGKLYEGNTLIAANDDQHFESGEWEQNYSYKRREMLEKNKTYYIVFESEKVLENVRVAVSDAETTVHFVDKWTETVAPDCATKGKEEGYCFGCKTNHENEIPELGHDYEEGYTPDKEATVEATGLESRHCKNYDKCGATKDARIIPKLESVYAEVESVVQDKNVEDLTEDDKTAVKEQVAALTTQASVDAGENNQAVAKEVDDNLDTTAVVALEELYIAADDSVKETAVEVTGLSAGEVKVEGAALSVEKHKDTSAEDTATYQSQLTINTTDAKDNAELSEKVDNNEAVVLDITMNIVKEEGNTTEVVAEDIQPVAPIKITLPVPDNMKAGFKLYHYEDGATEPEEIPYTIVKKGDAEYIEFVAVSFSYYSLEKEEHEHVWQDKAGEFKKATCQTAGYKVEECSVEGCSMERTVDIDSSAEFHNFVVEETVEATCQNDGYTSWKCTVEGCSETQTTDSVEKSEALHDFELKESVEQNCKSEGYDLYECVHCKETEKRNETEQLEHSYKVVVTKEATCEEEGSQYKECTTCGDKSQETAIKKVSHVTLVGKAVEPTCTEKGKTAGSSCAACGEVLEESIELKATGHTNTDPVKENIKEATCTEPGSYDEVVYCGVCGEEISRNPKVISSKGHTYKDGVCECGDVEEHDHKCDVIVESVAPTCTNDGYEVKKCKVDGCDYKITEAKSATGHTPEEAAVENVIEATCKKPGSHDEVVYCEVCDEELSRTQVIDKKAHTEAEPVIENKTEASCEDRGSYDEVVYCSVCGEELSRTQKLIKATGHTPKEAVVENKVEATCTESGSYDEVVYCAVCGEELSRTQKLIEATGHTPGKAVEENRKEATCTESGSYDEVIYCAVCGEELSRSTKVIDSLGHTYVDGVCGCGAVEEHNHIWMKVPEESKAPTCTADGFDVEKCTINGCKEKREVAKEALGHTPDEAVIENKVPATCTADGSYDEVVYCDICGEELSREQRVIETEGHKYENGTCKNCGEPDPDASDEPEEPSVPSTPIKPSISIKPICDKITNWIKNIFDWGHDKDEPDTPVKPDEPGTGEPDVDNPDTDHPDEEKPDEPEKPSVPSTPVKPSKPNIVGIIGGISKWFKNIWKRF